MRRIVAVLAVIGFVISIAACKETAGSGSGPHAAPVTTEFGTVTLVVRKGTGSHSKCTFTFNPNGKKPARTTPAYGRPLCMPGDPTSYTLTGTKLTLAYEVMRKITVERNVPSRGLCTVHGNPTSPWLSSSWVVNKKNCAEYSKIKSDTLVYHTKSVDVG